MGTRGQAGMLACVDPSRGDLVMKGVGGLLPRESGQPVSCWGQVWGGGGNAARGTGALLLLDVGTWQGETALSPELLLAQLFRMARGIFPQNSEMLKAASWTVPCFSVS